jgi:activator of HSP90 ATPase
MCVAIGVVYQRRLFDIDLFKLDYKEDIGLIRNLMISILTDLLFKFSAVESICLSR